MHNKFRRKGIYGFFIIIEFNHAVCNDFSWICFQKCPVSDMKSGNGYSTPTSRKSQAHWNYAQSIAPDIFISLGKILGIIEIIFSVVMFLFHVSSDITLVIGSCVGVGFLLFAFYKTDSEIEKFMNTYFAKS